MKVPGLRAVENFSISKKVRERQAAVLGAMCHSSFESNNVQQTTTGNRSEHLWKSKVESSSLLSSFPKLTIRMLNHNAAQNTRATLEDYIHFHGMLCNPGTAARCIQSFDGSVLFMPKAAADAANLQACSLQKYEFSSGRLTLLSYYLLVLVSWTGFLTVIGRTKSLIGREEDVNLPLPDLVQAEIAGQRHNLMLGLDRNRLLVHVQSIRPDTTELFIKRRFEYEFGNIVSVVMLHLVCDQGRLHLFEIYHMHNPLLRYIVKSLSTIVAILKGILFPLQKKEKKNH
jgi:hypothetical protein